jgi:PAS domain S-box-containing protein
MVSNAVSWADRIGAGNGVALLFLIALVLLACCIVLVAFIVRSRRRLVQEIREIVLALEDLRVGGGRKRADVGRDSVLNLIADALHRVGKDVDARINAAESALEQSQAVQDAVQSSAVITTDNDGDIRSFSSGAAGLFGWEEAEVRGKPASLLFHESSYEKFLPKLARRSLRERGIDQRVTLLRQDGTAFTADLSVRMLRNAAHEQVGFVMVVRDVTAQAKLEAELRQAEQRYRGLVEGLADGVLIVRDGRILYSNPAFAALTGMTDAQLERTMLRDRVATGDVLLVEETLAELQAEPGRVIPLNCGLHGADRSTRLEVRLHAASIEYVGGPAVLLMVRDETPERRIEAELRRNESQLDAVLEGTSDGILVLSDSADGGVVHMTNRAFAELFGMRQEDLLGLPLAKLVRALGGRGGRARDVIALLLGGDAARRETVVLGGPSPRELQVSVAPLEDRYGSPIGRVLACRDLTHQRESQRKLQQRAEELQLSKVMLEQAYRRLDAVNRDMQLRSAELDRLNEELRTLDEMKSNLLGNVSHELQTPLVSIRGYTEMILKERLGPISADQRKGLNLCLKNIDRLISMIDNLLAFTRAEPDLGELRLSRFPLLGLVHEAATLLREPMQARAIEFETRVEPEDLEVHADRDKILQVFLNLVSNAIKYNRQGGRIEVRGHPAHPGFVEVQVVDTGVGIPEEALDKIFERSYQVEEEGRRRAEGSGIGLAIVRDVLRLHGCRIAVHSEEERGTRFAFTLPASSERAREEQPEEPTPTPVAEEPAPTDPPSAEPQASPDAQTPQPSEDPDAPRPRFRIIRRDS